MTALFQNTYHELLKSRQWTPAWLRATRKKSYEKFLAEGLPTRRLEDWKYTSTRSLQDKDFALAEAADIDALRLKAVSLKQADRIVFINGRYAAGHSQLPADVSVVPLIEAVKHADSARLIHAAANKQGVDSLADLNQALFSSGAVIRVRKSLQSARPLQLVFLQTPGASALISPRNIVHVEKHANVAILESHAGDTTHFTNAVSDIWVETGARCQYILERVLGDQAQYVSTHRFHVARDAQVETFNLALGGRLNRSHLIFNMNAPGAAAKLDGLYQARKDNHIDNVTEVNHFAAHTTSTQLYKGILEDKSRAVFNGKIAIARDAQQVAAHQLNKNLLMSKDAEVDSRPQLVIDANDVKCSHGASIGQINEQELFYLQSRAIPRDEAKDMLAKAFALDVLNRITGPHFTEHLHGVLRTTGGQLA